MSDTPNLPPPPIQKACAYCGDRHKTTSCPLYRRERQLIKALPEVRR